MGLLPRGEGANVPAHRGSHSGGSTAPARIPAPVPRPQDVQPWRRALLRYECTSEDVAQGQRVAGQGQSGTRLDFVLHSGNVRARPQPVRVLRSPEGRIVRLVSTDPSPAAAVLSGRPLSLSVRSGSYRRRRDGSCTDVAASPSGSGTIGAVCSLRSTSSTIRLHSSRSLRLVMPRWLLTPWRSLSGTGLRPRGGRS